MKYGAEAVAVGAGLATLYALLEHFRRTSHGANPWTVEGFVGAAFIHSYVKTAAAATSSHWNSVFRSPAIQRALYEAKRKDPAQWAVVQAGAKARGVSTEQYVEMLSTGSRHTRGLAADFSGKPITELSRSIFELAKLGRIGPVKKVLDERDHAHVEWWAPWETAKAPVLETL